MSPDSFSSWEVRRTCAHKEHYPDSPQRGSEVFVNQTVGLLLCLTWFFLLSDRDMLHNLPLHMCCRDQLWTVPLSPLHVWHTRGHQSRLWLVHVLCMGRTGPYVAGWFLVHTGSFSLPSTNPRGAQTPAGERLRVTGCSTSNRHLSHPETVMSPEPETVLPRDSEQREPSQSLARRTTGWTRGDIWLKTISVPLVLFSVPFYEWTVLCYCLLLKRRIVIQNIFQ